ncbi:MAG: hypothetical protein RIC55_08990 [Pirellulaceae bacterium]
MQRKTVFCLAIALVAVNSLVFAQDRGQSMKTWTYGEDKANLLKSDLQRILEKYQDDEPTELDELFGVETKASQLNRERVENFNALNRDLGKQREPIAADIDFMNNVTSLRKKDDLDRWVEERMQKFNEDGGVQRLGVVNPYDGSKYYRYYDDNGDLIVSEVRNSYELIEQQKADWDKTYERAQDALESVGGDMREMARTFSDIKTIQAMIAQRRQTPTRPTNPDQRNSLVGTRWRMSTSDDATDYIEFLANGRLRATDNTGTYGGTWSQNGSTVAISIRGGFARVNATLQGDSLVGTGSNRDGQRWSFSATRQ